ncbi:MAG TPA: mechanosensitive ion channel domain-containing protein [Candidatus Didemnitutus sp.]|nr:mechanosensitive ion channel domain-containing protein [Candidatus Didemnitutus sp.]
MSVAAFPFFSVRRVALGLFLLAAAALLPAARDDERIAQLQDEIRTLQTLAADSANAAEKPALDRRLEGLRQELSILEKRQALENKEVGLRSGVSAAPRERLHERLQAIPLDTVAAEGRLRDLVTRRAAATEDRDALHRRMEDLPKRGNDDSATTTARAQLKEKLYTANEQLQAIALQQGAVEIEIDLIRQAVTIREELRAAEAPARPSLRRIFQDRIDARGTNGAGTSLDERIANFTDSIHNGEAALALARQDIARLDEIIKAQEQQTSFLSRNPQVEQLLATERAQRELLGERLPFLADQVAALRKSRELLRSRVELTNLEQSFNTERVAAMQAAYLKMLTGPLVAGLIIILAYLLISRVVLPRRYKREELFLARRLGRYAVALLVAIVAAFYMIDDLTLLATTLGLVSAAVVISLQDMCAAFFGWFAIMFGRKFTIGDRLEIEGVRGDVLDIQILRTTLIEVNNWLGVDQPTGRVLFVPNNFIFKSKVFNFNHGHPYIWGKIEVTVTYGTPTASATALFSKVLEEETREEFLAARNAAAVMERRYGVEDADYRPKIYTRIADSGVLFSLIYVSHYRNSSGTRNRINRRLIAELETHKHIQLAYNTLQVLASSTQADTPSAVLGTDATTAPFAFPKHQL